MSSNDTKILNNLRKHLKQQEKIDWYLEHKDMEMFIGELIHFIDSERGLVKAIDYSKLNYDYEPEPFNPSIMDNINN